ncbi:hypothetical protein ACHAQA_003945 [Verticillium albo-atrum]
MSVLDMSPSSSPSGSEDHVSPESAQNDTLPATPQTQARAPLDATTGTTDSEKHPKGKRKRTAAKDKSILEDSYQTNPKPDKTARQELVQRVSLNEKEVQIWFQNRRQNDRRKSRPLSPQEIAALRYGGMQVLSSDPATSSSLVDADISHGGDSFSTPIRPLDPGPTSSQNRSFIQSFVDKVKESTIDSGPQDEAPAVRSSSPCAEPETQQNIHAISTPPTGTMGYLANRWNLSNSFPAASASSRAADALK